MLIVTLHYKGIDDIISIQGSLKQRTTPYSRANCLETDATGLLQGGRALRRYDTTI